MTRKKRVKSSKWQGAAPQILPREPLTKKARAAIQAYAFHKSQTSAIGYVLIDRTLKDERMRRTDLYSWLEKQGYKWLSHYGFWSQNP